MVAEFRLPKIVLLLLLLNIVEAQHHIHYEKDYRYDSMIMIRQFLTVF